MKTQNAFFFGIAVMVLLSILFLSCKEKTDPFPPLREISGKIFCDSCRYEIKSTNYLETGLIYGYDSITVLSEHIEKGQQWSLTVHKYSGWDSVRLWVNRQNITPEVYFGDTMKIYSFKIQN